MQRPNEEKRRKIAAHAARLFAARPFDQVRLEDVAAAARVGKGTLYIYFKSKEHLYASLIRESFAELVRELTGDIDDDAPADRALEEVIDRLVTFFFKHPNFFELARTGLKNGRGPQSNRRKLSELIEVILRRGVRQGLWSDPHPDLTAVFIPGMVRSAMRHGSQGLRPQVLRDQILWLVRGALQQGKVRR